MSSRRIVTLLLMAGLLLLSGPRLAAAQNAVLYEVSETMKIVPRSLDQYRVASASLVGAIDGGPSICPVWLVQMLRIARCDLTATATSDINVATGTGTVWGRFWVVVQGDNAADGAEAVIASGELRGTIDLSLALRRLAPLGSLVGTWEALGGPGPLSGVKAEGQVTGTFRLPTLAPAGCADDGDPSDCTPIYVVPEHPAGFVAISPAEWSLGVPTVRLELKFTQGLR
jgi:hypothetical protein